MLSAHDSDRRKNGSPSEGQALNASVSETVDGVEKADRGSKA